MVRIPGPQNRLKIDFFKNWVKNPGVLDDSAYSNVPDGGRVFAPPTVLNFEKSKSIRKNQQFFTNGHFPAPYDPIGKTVTLTFQARSVRTHFRGVVMGSNADFNKNA